jgi:type II secretory pathway component PulJ
MAELIVAVLIGALVLSILMSFITTSMNEITYSNKQTEVIEKINAFSTSINNYK